MREIVICLSCSYKKVSWAPLSKPHCTRFVTPFSVSFAFFCVALWCLPNKTHPWPQLFAVRCSSLVLMFFGSVQKYYYFLAFLTMPFQQRKLSSAAISWWVWVATEGKLSDLRYALVFCEVNIKVWSVLEYTFLSSGKRVFPNCKLFDREVVFF